MIKQNFFRKHYALTFNTYNQQQKNMCGKDVWTNAYQECKHEKFQLLYLSWNNLLDFIICVHDSFKTTDKTFSIKINVIKNKFNLWLT